MSELDFLIGQTVVEVRDEERIVFEGDARPEPRLYADVVHPLLLGFDRTPLALAEVIGRTVSHVSTSGGTLNVTFDDGATLRADPDPECEAWQVVGGSPESLVVCLPDGELAVMGAADTAPLMGFPPPSNRDASTPA